MCLVSHLCQKNLCVYFRDRVYISSRVCTEIPRSLSLLQLPSPLLFAAHPSVQISSNTQRTGFGATDPLPLQLPQRTVPEAAVNTISSPGEWFLLTTSSQTHLVILYSFICLSSLPDALLVPFPPEDGVSLQRAWGHKNTFVLVMQSHLLTHDCTTQKHPPHPNALLAAAVFSWCLIVLRAGEVHGNSSVPNCFLQQLQTQHIISRQVHITTRPLHVRFPLQKRNRKSLLQPPQKKKKKREKKKKGFLELCAPKSKSCKIVRGNSYSSPVNIKKNPNTCVSPTTGTVLPTAELLKIPSKMLISPPL